MNYQISALLQLLNPDNSINANRLLAHAIGMTETIIYSALISKYVYYDREEKTENGWFYVTMTDLQESTTFGEKPQRTAIKHLVEHNLIECELKGIPAKRYFRIINNLEILEQLLITGSEIAKKIKENKRQREKSGGTCSSQTAEQASPEENIQFRPNGGTSSSQMADKTKTNKTKDNKPNLINQSVSLSAEPEPLSTASSETDGQTDRLKRQYSEILECIGVKLNHLSFVPMSEQDFLTYSENDRKTAECTIPYELKANKTEMEEALKYLFAYSYYSVEMDDSRLKLMNTVISAITEMTEKDIQQYQGETVKYYEIIDEINEIVHSSSLADWFSSFETEWQSILVKKSESKERIKSLRAFMKSCIWNSLKDYQLNEACYVLEADGLFGKHIG